MKKKIITSLLVASAASLSAQTPVGDATQGAQTADQITVDTTWAVADSPIILNDIVYVTGGATLTIEPGVIVRGQPRTDTSTFNPGALVITDSGRINAVGEPSNPIIFTTAAMDTDKDGIADGVEVEITTVDGDDVRNQSATRWQSGDGLADFLDSDPAGNPLAPAVYDTNGEIVTYTDTDGDTVFAENRQLWGGVIMMGEAPVNTDVTAAGGLGREFIEGLPDTNPELSAFGGNNPNDNSGSLAYVSIRHGGAVVGSANEINGLTMGGVGFGTRIDHIEVYCNADDGFEWFGGTVNTSHLAAIFNNDDSFDHDIGFTGLGQFWFSIFNDDGRNGDKAAEHDGETGDVNSLGLPETFPVIYNATYIGSGSSSVRATEAFRIRDNWGGAYYNSIFTEFPGDAIEFELDGFDRYNVEGEVIFHENTWFDFGVGSTPDDLTKVGDAGNPAVDAANELAAANIFTADATNRITDPGFATFNRRIANGVNPVPALNAGTVNNGTSFGEPETATFFEDAAYKGAFSTDSSETLWTTGWTSLNIRGILVDRGDGINAN
jgi:hypothetical protein